MQNSTVPSLDLSGKLIIKVQLGDDIRRIPIHNEDITYDELVLMMQRVYSGKLSTSDDIIIKYKDEDGDLITIFDNSDLVFAIQCSRILKLTLFVNGLQPTSTADGQSLRQELQHLRDCVNAILDRIEPVPAPSSAGDTSSSIGRGTEVTDKGKAMEFIVARPGEGKEFDPLSAQLSASSDDSTQNKVMSAFGIAGTVDRAGAATPDSISSVGSSSSIQQKKQQIQQQRLQPSPVQQSTTPAVFGTTPAGQDQQLQQQGTAPYMNGGEQQAYSGHVSAPYAEPDAPPMPLTQEQQQQYPRYVQPMPAVGFDQYSPGQLQPQPQSGIFSQPGAPQMPLGPQQPQSAYNTAQWNMQQAPAQKVPGFIPSASPGQHQSPSSTLPGANPYAKGAGYGAGYPRPKTYQQGYQ